MIKALAMSLLAVSPLTAACSDTATDAHPVVADLAPSLSVQTVNGSGCAPSTVTTTVGANDVTVTYTGFAVTAVGTNNRKVCQFNVLVHPGRRPAGRRRQRQPHRHGDPAGRHVGHRLHDLLRDRRQQPRCHVVPADRTLVERQPADPGRSVVTACGTDVALNIKVELKVSGTGSAAAANTSDVHVNWQSC
jgi:hypothetical protein